ncbi:transmembrane protein 276, partial [Mycteria americana]|uniref:transmembrane protein 276 n=1 Tax=Mycteria americana TaxID=33587 RepID=UPI003F585F8D
RGSPAYSPRLRPPPRPPPRPAGVPARRPSPVAPPSPSPRPARLSRRSWPRPSPRPARRSSPRLGGRAWRPEVPVPGTGRGGGGGAGNRRRGGGEGTHNDTGEGASAPARADVPSLPQAREAAPAMGAGPGGGRALSQALLCAVCLLCARRARQVTGGPAAGFLLQALAAASDALEPLWAGGTPGGDPDHPHPDPLPGAWVSAMLAQPLVAFGFHRLSGDRATANLLLGGAAALAPAAARLPEEGRVLAARAVTVLTAGSVLALSVLTANGPGALGGLLLAAGNLLPIPLPGTRHEGHPWVLAAGNLALERALRVQQLGVDRGGEEQ